jgi:hypothetical protein
MKKENVDKLKEKKRVMDDELVMFSDPEGLKRKSEARKQQLVVEKQNLGFLALDITQDARKRLGVLQPYLVLSRQRGHGRVKTNGVLA